MGGGDLNLKKSWHPSTFANLEKVWKAEQKHETEQKKIEQLQQELKEERAREEIQRVAAEAGAVKKKNDRVDWLYSGPAASVNREEYLLGKKIDRMIDPTLVEAEREREALASEAGALFVEKGSSGANTVADLAVKIREDPLFIIKQKEVEAKKKLASNPIKLKRLQQLLVTEGKCKSSNSHGHKKKKKHKRVRDDSEPPRRTRESDQAPPSPPRSHTHYNLNRTHKSTDERGQSSSLKPSSSSRYQPYNKPRSRTRRMDPKELERRRKEMISDAKEHDKQRGRRLRLHEKQEQTSEEKKTNFLQPLRVQSLSTSSSLGDRIHRNINAVQRTPAKLDSNFMCK